MRAEASLPEPATEFDASGFLERALSVLALRLRHEVALHRALRGPSGQEGFGGLLLDGDEAERMLEVLAGRLGASGTAEPLASITALEARLGRDRLAPGSIWARLAGAFGLDELALDLVTLAAAPLVDPRFGRAYGFLADDISRRYLTPALALRLLGRHGPGLADLRARLAPTAALPGWGLITVGPERPLIEAPLRTDEALLDLLLAPGMEMLPPATAPGGPWLLAPGEDALAQLAGLAGRPLVLIASESLGLHRAAAADWRAQARAVALQGALPVLMAQHGPALPAERRGLAQAVVAGQAVLTPEPQAWLETGLSAVVLTAAAGAETQHQGRDRVLAGLAERMPPRLALTDLVLTARTRAALEDMVAAAGQQQQVLERWGFGRVWGKAPGLTALFRGPSGTGKTSAAGAIAQLLALPLYRVNLAGLMSKYIGETEKNLDRLFLAAEGQDLVLFFDEADAAFGKRGEVSDAHDRYANLGTAFLLQRLETHPGLTILATNLQDNIDTAFLRRIDAVVDFPPPGKDERAVLWQRLLLTDAPHEALDFAALADHQLTGAEIRNACLSAACHAAEAGQALTMAGLSRAIAVELAKKGRPLRRADFGEHFAAGRGEGHG